MEAKRSRLNWIKDRIGSSLGNMDAPKVRWTPQQPRAQSGMRPPKSAAVGRCGVPSQIGNSALKVVPEVSTIGASAIHQNRDLLVGEKIGISSCKN